MDDSLYFNARISKGRKLIYSMDKMLSMQMEETKMLMRLSLRSCSCKWVAELNSKPFL